jgi:hypothetical protein
MPQLDNYLVSLGMKGQNVVLSTMDKIRKKGGDLTKKKTVVPLSVKTGPTKTDKTITPEKPTPGQNAPGRPSRKSDAPTETSTPPSPFSAPPSEGNKKFRQAAEKFGGGVKDFASAASTLDPVATISSVKSAIGTSLSGISVLGVSLGRLPEGIAAIANSTLSMAKNSVDMAKQSTAAFHQLTTRNAAAGFYGKEVTEKGPLSRNERAMFIDAVSGSTGKIQKPLADEINKLIGAKDTWALARAGAGDWESTGTDKGWMLGQISSSFQGLPPSIKQKLQASLLKNYSSEIQDMAPGQVDVQRRAATFADQEEKQTERLYGESAKNENLVSAIAKMNDLQVALFNTGLKFTTAIDTAATKLATLPAAIDKMLVSLKKFVDDPSMRNARTLMKSIDVVK